MPTTPQPSLFKQIKPAIEIEVFTPVTPLPILLKKAQTTTEDTLAPVAPSGFVNLPGTIGRTLAIPAVQVTQAVIQRTVAVIRPYLPIDDPLTERVPTPPKPNPLFRWETLIIIVVLLVTGLAHGINMFHYPYIESDEGTYLSQAWAVFHLGRLGYYTYFYDHVPGGWIQIALWGLLTGGFHTFGSAVYSGRIFMFLLEIGSTFFLYRIARQISGNIVIAVIICLLSAFSPYGLYFQRRVLLDNIMTFWMLLSISFLVRHSISLKHVWLSAVTLSISILSKEVTAFIIPAMAYLVFLRVHRSHRRFALVGWIALVSVIVSLYPLLAIIKGELFPSGTFLGGTAPHVSLIGTVLYQAGRGKDGGIRNFHSFFWMETIKWIYDDPVLVVGGCLGAILSVLLMKRYQLHGAMGLITLSLWAFIARGGVVLDFYLIPFIPMLALNIGLILCIFIREINHFSFLSINQSKIVWRISQLVITLFCIFSVSFSLSASATGLGYRASNVGSPQNPLIYWNGTQADAQMESITWVEQHIPHNSRIIIDMFMWPDLYTAGYHNAHYYWKLEKDPAIRDSIFHNNWRNVDYLITSPQMLVDMQLGDLTLIRSLIENSSTVAAFDTGHWRIDIRKVRK